MAVGTIPFLRAELVKDFGPYYEDCIIGVCLDDNTLWVPVLGESRISGLEHMVLELNVVDPIMGKIHPTLHRPWAIEKKRETIVIAYRDQDGYDIFQNGIDQAPMHLDGSGTGRFALSDGRIFHGYPGTWSDRLEVGIYEISGGEKKKLSPCAASFIDSDGSYLYFAVGQSLDSYTIARCHMNGKDVQNLFTHQDIRHMSVVNERIFIASSTNVAEYDLQGNLVHFIDFEWANQVHLGESPLGFDVNLAGETLLMALVTYGSRKVYRLIDEF